MVIEYWSLAPRRGVCTSLGGVYDSRPSSLKERRIPTGFKREHKILMALSGGSTRISWHSMEGAQDSHGTQWREHKILTALSGGSMRFSGHSMEGAQDSHGTQWREHEILGALNGGSTRFSRHSVEGA
jgi:hypothetical protein